jgi:hypothetical protein
MAPAGGVPDQVKQVRFPPKADTLSSVLDPEPDFSRHQHFRKARVMANADEIRVDFGVLDL